MPSSRSRASQSPLSQTGRPRRPCAAEPFGSSLAACPSRRRTAPAASGRSSPHPRSRSCRRPRLQADHARHQRTGRSHDRASGFQQQLLVPMAARVDAARDRADPLSDRRRRLVAVRNSQSSAEVEVVQPHALALQLDRPGPAAGRRPARAAPPARSASRCGSRSRSPADADRPQRGGTAPRPGRARRRTCSISGPCDVRCVPGIDIRVHAQRYRSALTERGGDARDSLQLELGLDVEAQDAGAQRGSRSRLPFSRPREHDPRRRAAGRDHAGQFAAGNDVEIRCRPAPAG